MDFFVYLIAGMWLAIVCACLARGMGYQKTGALIFRGVVIVGVVGAALSLGVALTQVVKQIL